MLLCKKEWKSNFALKDELTADLEKVNNVELMRGDGEMAAALQDQMGFMLRSRHLLRCLVKKAI